MALKYNPSFIPQRTRVLIIDDWKNGIDKEEIAGKYRCKVPTINTYIRRYNETHNILSEYEYTKKYGVVTRKKKFDDANLSSFASDECISAPKTPLHRYTQDICNSFEIYTSPSTVSRYFKGMKWNWKKITRVAMEVDLFEQKLFWDYMGNIVADKKQLLFLDESNRFDTDVNPTHGRGPGRVVEKVALTRGGYKLSLLLVTWHKGVLCYQPFPGAVNEEKFNKFIRNELIFHINPYPGNCSIIALDNIGFRHNSIFFTMMMDMNVVIAHLPHYDPPVNLTEHAFRDIKQIERSKNIYGYRDGLESLCMSVERIKNKDWTSTLKQIGYIH